MNTSDPLGAMGHQKSGGEGDRLSLGGHHHHHHHQSAVSQMLYGAAGLSTGRSGKYTYDWILAEVLGRMT